MAKASIILIKLLKTNMLYYGGLSFMPPYSLHKCCHLVKDIDKSDTKLRINY